MKKISLALAAVIAAAAVAWAVAGRSGSHDSMTMGRSGTTMMTDTMSNDVSASFDQRFIDEMVPHHQMAVDMAKVVIERGTHPELRTMAQAIVTAQDAEITQMRNWRKEWFGSAATPASMSDQMPGMDLAAVGRRVRRRQGAHRADDPAPPKRDRDGKPRGDAG